MLSDPEPLRAEKRFIMSFFHVQRIQLYEKTLSVTTDHSGTPDPRATRACPTNLLTTLHSPRLDFHCSCRPRAPYAILVAKQSCSFARAPAPRRFVNGGVLACVPVLLHYGVLRHRKLKVAELGAQRGEEFGGVPWDHRSARHWHTIQ